MKLKQKTYFVTIMIIISLILTYAACDNTADDRKGDGYDIILQAWHWNLVKNQPVFNVDGTTHHGEFGNEGTLDLTNDAPGGDNSWYDQLRYKDQEFKDDGFSIIYFPPPWREVMIWYKDLSPPTEDDFDNPSSDYHTCIQGGGEGYTWIDFNLDSNYGTKQELIECTSALSGQGLKVIYDMVPNHRDRGAQNSEFCQSLNPPVPDQLIWADDAYWRYVDDTGNVYNDDGGPFLDGSMDINTEKPEVYDAILNAMNVLMDECHADGWRWDLPWGWKAERTDQWMNDTNGTESFSMGEYWPGSPNSNQDFNTDYAFTAGYRKGGFAGNDVTVDEGVSGAWRDRICYWIDKAESPAMDFILKAAINEASYGGAHLLRTKPTDYKALITEPYYKDKAITFVCTHDTDASPECDANGWGQKLWVMDDDFKKCAYAYIMSLPGIPMVYWPDYYTWNLRNYIQPCMQARKDAGVCASSEYRTMGSDEDGYAAITTNASGDDALAIAIDSNWEPGDGWVVKAQDVDDENHKYKIWIKDTTSTTTTTIPITVQGTLSLVGTQPFLYKCFLTNDDETFKLKGPLGCITNSCLNQGYTGDLCRLSGVTVEVSGEMYFVESYSGNSKRLIANEYKIVDIGNGVKPDIGLVRVINSSVHIYKYNAETIGIKLLESDFEEDTFVPIENALVQKMKEEENNKLIYYLVRDLDTGDYEIYRYGSFRNVPEF